MAVFFNSLRKTLAMQFLCICRILLLPMQIKLTALLTSAYNGNSNQLDNRLGWGTGSTSCFTKMTSFNSNCTTTVDNMTLFSEQWEYAA